MNTKDLGFFELCAHYAETLKNVDPAKAKAWADCVRDFREPRTFFGNTASGDAKAEITSESAQAQGKPTSHGNGRTSGNQTAEKP